MSRSTRATIAAVLGAAVIPIFASAQQPAGSRVRAEKLDSIAGAGVRANTSVGLVAAVVKGKETRLLTAYGKADADGNVSMTVSTILPIASVTKQFTAAAILQLRDAGILSLDDAITTWLPEFGTRGRGVTLRHLLGHTAGVVELGEMPELRAAQMMRNPNLTRDSVYRIISTYPFQFPAGTMQVYSNTGFWLLGRIVEQASGTSYEEYLKTKIFAPLGMARSMYCNTAEKSADRAYGHGVRNGITRRAPDIMHTGTYSAGAICSTVDDMVTWLQALHGGRVLTPRSYAEMIAPARLNDGTPTRYGMGLSVWLDRRGLREIGHDGGGFGFSSQAWWHPDTQLAIVLLTNSEPDNTNVTAEALAAEVLGPAKSAAFTGDATQLSGTYKGQGRSGKEMVIAVTQAPEGLAITIDGGAVRPLQWVEGWRFRLPIPLLTFLRTGNSGSATELRFDTGGDHIILKRQ